LPVDFDGISQRITYKGLTIPVPFEISSFKQTFTATYTTAPKSLQSKLMLILYITQVRYNSVILNHT
jgi:hypothetical protein